MITSSSLPFGPKNQFNLQRIEVICFHEKGHLKDRKCRISKRTHRTGVIPYPKVTFPLFQTSQICPKIRLPVISDVCLRSAVFSDVYTLHRTFGRPLNVWPFASERFLGHFASRNCWDGWRVSTSLHSASLRSAPSTPSSHPSNFAPLRASKNSSPNVQFPSKRPVPGLNV